MQNTIITDVSSIDSILFPVLSAPVRGVIDGKEIIDTRNKLLCGRDADGGIFPVSVVGAKFAEFPYADVYNVFSEAMADVVPGATLSKAGVLDGGGRFFATFDLPEDVSPFGGEDETRTQITLRSALNGKWKNSLSFGFWRMVCSNGLARYTLKEMLLGFKRTLNAELRIPELHSAVERALKGGEQYKADMSRLVEMPLATPEMRALVAGFFATDKGELSTRARGTVDAIVSDAFHSPGVRGESAYDLLNGFTHYFSHARGESEKSAAQWFDSHAFGSDARHKASFADALLGNRDALLAKGRKALLAA